MVAVVAVVASAGALGLAGLDGGPQALGVEGLCEDDLDLGGGLLGGDEGGEPFAGDDVEDGVGDRRLPGNGLCRRSRSGGASTRSSPAGGRAGAGVRWGRAGRTSPWAARTRYSVDGDTQTRFS